MAQAKTETTKMQVAQTILAQLGGNKFLAMTGARDLVGSDNALRFRLPRGAKAGITHMTVRLDASDTYSVEAIKFSARNLRSTPIAARSDVYADSLREVFEGMTGLYTRL